MQEVWENIKGYEKLYQISTLGRVKSLQKNKIMKIRRNKKYNYCDVLLRKNKKNKRFYIHRLVAEIFIYNPKNYPIINHKDEDKTNNRVDNLEWCTYKYNSNYRTINSKSKVRKVIQYDANGKFIKKWNNIKEIQEKLKIYHISEVCNNKRKMAGNYIWKFEN
jgi:hypothetical protein